MNTFLQAVVLWFARDRGFGKAELADGRQVFLPRHSERTLIVSGGKIFYQEDRNIKVTPPATGNKIVVEVQAGEKGLSATMWAYLSLYDEAKKSLSKTSPKREDKPAAEPTSSADLASAVAPEAAPEPAPAPEEPSALKGDLAPKAKKAPARKAPAKKK